MMLTLSRDKIEMARLMGRMSKEEYEEALALLRREEERQRAEFQAKVERMAKRWKLARQ